MVETTITFQEHDDGPDLTRLEEKDVCTVGNWRRPRRTSISTSSFWRTPRPRDARLEGFIFPNTYDFYQGEQASSVINKFLTALHNRITADMWRRSTDAGRPSATHVIVASMIRRRPRTTRSVR
jgi:UPF0755 protein